MGLSHRDLGSSHVFCLTTPLERFDQPRDYHLHGDLDLPKLTKVLKS